MSSASESGHLLKFETPPLPPASSASLECLFEQLPRIHEQLLIRGFSDAVASSAVDEVLDVGRKALASGKAVRMNGEERAAWIWTVAKNAARRAASKEITLVSLHGDHPETRIFALEDETDELRTALYEEIDRLSGRQKEAITLHVLQALSFRMTARAMGLSPSTVGHHFNKAIARLATALHEVATRIHDEKYGKDSARAPFSYREVKDRDMKVSNIKYQGLNLRQILKC